MYDCISLEPGRQHIREEPLKTNIIGYHYVNYVPICCTTCGKFTFAAQRVENLLTKIINLSAPKI